jgi:hypothetical protein
MLSEGPKDDATVELITELGVARAGRGHRPSGPTAEMLASRSVF